MVTAGFVRGLDTMLKRKVQYATAAVLLNVNTTQHFEIYSSSWLRCILC